MPRSSQIDNAKGILTIIVRTSATMGVGQTPGPITSNHPPIDRGTLARVRTPAPGVVGGTGDHHLYGSGPRVRVHRPPQGNEPRSRPANGQPIAYVTVSFIIFLPVHTDWTRQLQVANEVFSCCNVVFRPVAIAEIESPYSTRFIGSDRTVEYDRDVDSEMNRVGRQFPQSAARVRVFFVRSTGGYAAFTIDRIMNYGGSGERIYISDNAVDDTLAHELGHLLLCEGDSWQHSNDPNNLLHDGVDQNGVHRTGRQLTPEQQRRIYYNATHPQGPDYVPPRRRGGR